MIFRSITPHIREMVKKYPVLTITGPRQSGKTTLARNLFPDFRYVNLEEFSLRQFAKTDPSGFFKSYQPPVILDEIQNCPELLSQVQVESDHIGKPGQFVLTGSQQLSLFDAVSQSLAGRTAIFTLLPLSVEELVLSGITLTRDECIYRGGMPRLFEMKIEASAYYRDYLRTYIERDVRSVLNVKNMLKFELFLSLLAGRIGQLVNLSSLSGDVGVSSTTLAEWLSVLEASHIIFRLPPWHGNIGKRLTKSPKLYFTEVALASYLLGIENPTQVARDPLRGNLFENLVVIEALKKALNSNATPRLFFFRTDAGLEIDLLRVHGQDMVPYEIKSADSLNAEFFSSLKSFRALFPRDVDTSLQTGGLIYSGTTIAGYSGWSCTNFADTAGLF